MVEQKHTNQYGCCGRTCRSGRRAKASGALRPREEASSSPALRAVQEYLQALSLGDIDGVLALSAPCARQIDLSAAAPSSAEPEEELKLRRERLEALVDAYAEIQFRLVESWESGRCDGAPDSRRIAFRWHADAVTHCGDEVALRGLDMFQVSPEGRIERHWLDLSPERYVPSEPCTPERPHPVRGVRRPRPRRSRRSVLEQ